MDLGPRDVRRRAALQSQRCCRSARSVVTRQLRASRVKSPTRGDLAARSHSPSPTLAVPPAGRKDRHPQCRHNVVSKASLASRAVGGTLRCRTSGRRTPGSALCSPRARQLRTALPAVDRARHSDGVVLARSLCRPLHVGLHRPIARQGDCRVRLQHWAAWTARRDPVRSGDRLLSNACASQLSPRSWRSMPPPHSSAAPLHGS